MNVKINRIFSSEFQTLGILTIYDKHNFPFWECRTLELPDLGNQSRISCIPDGKYEVIKRNSAKYGDHFHILDVPNRSYILIHNANYVRQLLGCCAVGLSHTDIDGDGLRDVTRSKSTMRDLNRILPDKFQLHIYG